MNEVEKEFLCIELDCPMGIVAIGRFIGRIEDGELPVSYLYELSMERNDKAGFHAAWILEKLCEKTPDYAEFLLEDLARDFDKIRNQSSMRAYAKLLSRLLRQQKRGKLSETLSTILLSINPDKQIETCFAFLINPKVRISVKQMCCELLLFYKEKETWIKEELQEFAANLALQNTPAAQSYRKKLLKALKV